MFEFKSLLNTVKNTDWKKYFLRSFFVIFIILTITFSITVNVIVNNNELIIKNEITKNVVTSLISYTNLVENAINTCDNYYHGIITNNYVMNYFMLNDIADERAQRYMIDISKELKMFNVTNDAIDSIYMYNMNCDYILSVNGHSEYRNYFLDKGCFDEFEQNGKTVFYRKGKNGINDRDYISIVKAVQYGGHRGLVEFNLNCKSFQSSNDFYWVNDDNEVVFSENVDLIGKNISDCVIGYKSKTNNSNEIYYKNKTAVTEINIENTNMRIVIAANPDNNVNALGTGIVLAVVIILFLVISALIAFFVVTHLYNSVINIMIGIDSNSDDERHHIKYNILNELRRNRKLEQELQEKILLVNRAKSEALQAQINPHMLYNALNLIAVMELKQEHKNNNVVKSIGVLSNILRYAMDNSKTSVTLEEEIRNIQAFSYLLKQKYTDRFDISYDIGEDTKQLLVLKMTIQPIVENAVEHGIAPCSYYGLVTVSSFIENNMLVVRVADNGCGIDAENIEKINQGKYDNILDKSHTHGLMNANERIKLIYGRDYGCRIKSDEFGTVVDICYPILEGTK